MHSTHYVFLLPECGIEDMVRYLKNMKHSPKTNRLSGTEGNIKTGVLTNVDQYHSWSETVLLLVKKKSNK